MALGLEESTGTGFSDVAPALVRLLDVIRDELDSAEELLSKTISQETTTVPNCNQTIGA